MKKIFTFFLSMLMVGGAFAQQRADRMIVYEKSGQRVSYLSERVDSVKFVQLEGMATADIEVKAVDADSVGFVVTRNGICQAFKFTVLSKAKADMLRDEVRAADYIHRFGGDMYWNDFTNGKISTASLKPATDYAALTLAYDQYGTPCSVCRADFTTKAKPLAGKPEVTYTIDTVAWNGFSMTFRPNGDVGGYAVVSGEKGIIQDQYKSWGPMMGADNFSELIKMWGVPSDTVHTVKYDDFTPNTDYEVFLQVWDKNGVFAPCDTINIKTKMKGGLGEAFVTTTLGEYKNTDWNGQMLPSQFMTFTPNDQASCYRFAVELDSIYQKDTLGLQNYVAMDPPMPMANWFHFEALTTDFQINPSTKYVVVSAAKNGESKWCKVKVETYETPAAVVDPAKATVKKVSTSYRIIPRLKATQLPAVTKGSAPVIRKGEMVTMPRLAEMK